MSIPVLIISLRITNMIIQKLKYMEIYPQMMLIMYQCLELTEILQPELKQDGIKYKVIGGKYDD